MEGGVWTTMIPENAQVIQLHVAEAQGALYANAYNLATTPPSAPHMIQRYSFQSKSWEKVLDDTHDTTRIGQFVVGENSDEIYLSYDTAKPEDPIRHQKVFLWDGTEVRAIGKGRFYNGYSHASTPISIGNTRMHYDTNLKSLVISAANLNFIRYGDDEQLNNRPWELYAKKINRIVYYEPINDVWNR
jgi:hypothetical protein